MRACTIRWTSVTVTLVLSLGLGLAGLPAAAAAFTDDAGRTVVLPERVERVFGAGPPTAILLYTLAPERLVGWSIPLSPEAKALLPQPYAARPFVGRLTGRSPTANLEALLALRPDLIVDVGTVSVLYADQADRYQQQVRAPYVLLDGTLSRLPETYQRLGRILGLEERARRLADYGRRVLREVGQAVGTIPEPARKRVYYARGADGLETGLLGSINTEIIEYAGGFNVAREGDKREGLARVSLEQVLNWDPEVIIVADPAFLQGLRSNPAWARVRAVREGQVYLAPRVPFGWLGVPPSANRFLGLEWMAHTLYPEVYRRDLEDAVREFFALFYHTDLAAEQVHKLLADTRPH